MKQRNQYEKFVTVYSSILLLSIEIVKGALESEDILCNLKGYNSAKAAIDYVDGITGMEIQVPEKDKVKARGIIKELGVK